MLTADWDLEIVSFAKYVQVDENYPGNESFGSPAN